MIIDSFRGEYSFLSNFYPCAITFEGEPYMSVEHAFQAAKTLDLDQRLWVARAATSGIAKARGRRVTLRANWDGMRLRIMLELVRIKFQHRDLWPALLRTEPATLVEGNHWGDRFWGMTVADGEAHMVGENWLGRILMHVRNELVEGRQLEFRERP